MSAPNIEGTLNVDVVAGGVNNASVLGLSAATPAGMHGVYSVQSAALTPVTLSGTYASDYAALQTWVTAVQAALHAKGITA